MKTEFTKNSIELPNLCNLSRCDVQLTVENVSDHPFYFLELSHIPLLKISLVDSKGNPCPLTEKGKRYFDKERPPVAFYSSQLIWLEKGQPKNIKIDLAEHFKLAPGEWTLSLSLFLNEERAPHAPKKRTLNETSAIPPVEFKDIKLTVGK